MKRTKILYWVFTIIAAGLMLTTVIPNIMVTDEWVEIMHKQMGYPIYFIPFIGWAKLLGVIGILVPGFPRLKEWAYAGLFFDLIGVTYSSLALGTPIVQCLPMLMFILPLALSYIFYHKLQKSAQNA
jgi:hypothetical protein